MSLVAMVNTYYKHVDIVEVREVEPIKKILEYLSSSTQKYIFAVTPRTRIRAKI
jgi:hypothetical protein